MKKYLLLIIFLLEFVFFPGTVTIAQAQSFELYPINGTPYPTVENVNVSKFPTSIIITAHIFDSSGVWSAVANIEDPNNQTCPENHEGYCYMNVEYPQYGNGVMYDDGSHNDGAEKDGIYGAIFNVSDTSVWDPNVNYYVDISATDKLLNNSWDESNGADYYHIGNFTITVATGPTVTITSPLNNSSHGALVNFNASASNANSLIPNLDSSLVSWWRMNDSAWVADHAGDVVDSIGAHNGTAKGNAAITAAGKFGNGGVFDGNGDYINAGNPSAFNFGTGNFSVSLWFKETDSTSFYGIIGKYPSNPTSGAFDFGINGGHPDCLIRGNSTIGTYSRVYGSSPITDNTWYHLVAVRTGSTLTVYLNGSSIGSSSDLAEGTSLGTQNLIIGGRDTGDVFKGSLDEVMVFNRALTTDEITGLYNATAINHNSTLTEGSHTYKVYAEDAAGNVGFSDTNTFMVDAATGPTVTITSPANGAYYNATVAFNASGSGANLGFLVPNLDSSLVSWWRMDNIDGSGNPTDYINFPNGNNGTKAGDAHQVDAGKFGKGFAFDGNGDYIQAGRTFITGSFTASIWFNRAGAAGGSGATSYHEILANINGNSYASRILIDSGGGSARFQLTNGSGDAILCTSSAALSSGWNHIAVTYVNETGNLSIYLNGAVNSCNTGSGQQPGTGGLIMGVSGNGATNYNTNGSIDDVMIFNRALTTDEITELYNVTTINHNSTLTEGSHTYKVYAEDTAGNVGFSGTNTFMVDATAPITTATYNNGNYTPPATSNGTVNAVLGCFDSGGSGCAATWYCQSTTDGCTNWSAYVGSVSISTVGTNYFRYYSTDIAANSETIASQTIIINSLDTTPPVVTITSPANGANLNSALVSFSASATDAQLGFIVPNLDSSLVSWWRMEDNATNHTVTDYMGANNGTAQQNTSALTTTGKFGKGFSFDGTGDYISLPNLASSFTTEATLIMWIKLNEEIPSSGGKTGIAYLGTSGENTHYPWTNGTIYCDIFRNDRISFSSAVTKTDWHMLTVTNKPGANGYVVYQNLTQIYSGVGENVISLPASPSIGKSVGEFYLNGSIDEVMVFNRALTTDEITGLYSATAISHSSTLAEGSHTYKVYASDTAGNVGFAGPNTFTVDATAPVQSGWNPVSGSVIVDSTPTITFTLNEAGDCRLSLSDDSYDSMLGATDCLGDGTNSISCTAPDLGVNGSKILYIACKDPLGNKDTTATNTALTYTLTSLDTTPPVVTITSPANGANLNSAPVSFSASATDAQLGFIVPNLDSSLVSWWRMEDNATNHTVTDYMGANNGTAQQNTSALTTTGKFGKGFAFDGNGDYINAGNPSAFNFGTGNFSISLWFKTNTTSFPIGKYPTNASSGAIDCRVYVDSGGGIDCLIRGSSGIGGGYSRVIVSGLGLTDNSWHHLVAVRVDNTLSVYTDNVLRGSNSDLASGANLSGTQNLIIGGRDTGEVFNGSLDEVMVFNRALTTDEITALYNGTAAINHSSTLAEGSHTYKVYAEDLAGNVGSAGPNTFMVGTCATNNNATVCINTTPSFISSSTSSQTIASFTATHDLNAITLTATLPAAAYGDIVYFIDQVALTTGSNTVGPTGTVSYAYGASWTGTHTIEAIYPGNYKKGLAPSVVTTTLTK